MRSCEKYGDEINGNSSSRQICGESENPFSIKEDIEENKMLALLSYFGILVFVPIFAGKKSSFARFHANQGLALILVTALYTVFTSFLNKFFSVFSYSLAEVIKSIFSFGWLFIFILIVCGISNAVQGKFKSLPIIGNIKIL